jgi:hypothetical protein
MITAKEMAEYYAEILTNGTGFTESTKQYLEELRQSAAASSEPLHEGCK